MHRHIILAGLAVATLAGIAASPALAQTNGLRKPHVTTRKPPTVTRTAVHPLQAAAAKALATGKLAKWERTWYEQIATGKVTPRRVTVWQTQYGKHNGYGGDLYHLAANPRHLPLGTVVYLPSTGRLHVVTNRGADSNDRIARRDKNAAFWVDVWTERLGQYGWQSQTGSAWIVGRAPWPGGMR